MSSINPQSAATIAANADNISIKGVDSAYDTEEGSTGKNVNVHMSASDFGPEAELADDQERFPGKESDAINQSSQHKGHPAKYHPKLTADELAKRASNAASSTAQQASDKASELSESAKAGGAVAAAKATDLKNQGAAKLSELSAQAKPVLNQASAKASELAGQAQAKATEVKNQAADKASELSKQASAKSGEIKQDVSNKTADLKTQAAASAQNASESAKQTEISAKQKASNAAASGQSLASQAKNAAIDKIDSMSENADDTEEPEEGLGSNQSQAAKPSLAERGQAAMASMQPQIEKAKQTLSGLFGQVTGSNQSTSTSSPSASQQASNVKNQAAAKAGQVEAKAEQKADQAESGLMSRFNVLKDQALHLKDQGVHLAQDAITTVKGSLPPSMGGAVDEHHVTEGTHIDVPNDGQEHKIKQVYTMTEKEVGRDAQGNPILEKSEKWEEQLDQGQPKVVKAHTDKVSQ